MAGLTDQEIEVIAQRVAADLSRSGAPAAGDGRPTPNVAREIGIFDTLDDAVKAANDAFLQLTQLGLKKRYQIIDSIRKSMREHGKALAKMAHEETGLGRYEDKILKNELVTEKTPGPEDIIAHTVTG